MVSYTSLASTASQLLTSFGADAVISRTSGASFNAATGTYSGGSASSFTSKAVRFDYQAREIDGELIQRGDVRLVVETANGEPLIDDNCLFDSISYRVMAVETLSPSGTDLYYELQLRH